METILKVVFGYPPFLLGVVVLVTLLWGIGVLVRNTRKKS